MRRWPKKTASRRLQAPDPSAAVERQFLDDASVDGLHRQLELFAPFDDLGPAPRTARVLELGAQVAERQRPHRTRRRLQLVGDGTDAAVVFGRAGFDDLGGLTACRFQVLGEKLAHGVGSVSYTHLRAHETDSYLVCRL